MKTVIFDTQQPQVIYSKNTHKAFLCMNEQAIEVKVPMCDSQENKTGNYETVVKYQYDTAKVNAINDLDSTILEAFKKEILREIADYDYESYDNDGIHTFSINDTSMWFYREERGGLKQRVEAEKAAGKTTTNIWHETVKFEMPIEKALQILNDLEVYSSECYDVIQQHKANIENCTTIEEVAAYDIKAGFPERLSYTV